MNVSAKVSSGQRIHQWVFIFSMIVLSWLSMMAIHEFGHVLGAVVSGGVVERVILHPLTISRTDVTPNPNPLLVVWMGPIVGSFFPAVLWWLIPGQLVQTKTIASFFAGFCFIANGVYIGIGAFDAVGDCAVMIQNGSPIWLLVVFGVIAAGLGMLMWHGLGSAREFLRAPSLVEPRLAYGSLLALFSVVAIEVVFSPI